MKRFTLSTTLMGNVTDIKEEQGTFGIKCRSGDEFWVCVGRKLNLGLYKIWTV